MDQQTEWLINLFDFCQPILSMGCILMTECWPIRGKFLGYQIHFNSFHDAIFKCFHIHKWDPNHHNLPIRCVVFKLSLCWEGTSIAVFPNFFIDSDNKLISDDRLFDCQFFNADAWICMGENDEQAQRRYDWVEYEDGTLLGNKGTCKNKVKVDSWWRYVFWHCSYCLCKCEEIGDHSARYWSLVPAVSDTDNNMVSSTFRTLIEINKFLHR